MARSIHRLSPLGISKEMKPGHYADGGGLWLQVTPRSSKSWSFRYMLKGRAREMGLGPLNTVPLVGRLRDPTDKVKHEEIDTVKGDFNRWVVGARDKAQKCRELLSMGIDPIDHAKALQSRRLVDVTNVKTFDECAAAYIESMRRGWKSAKHAEQWTNTLATYVRPVFGHLPVSHVDTPHIVEALNPIWGTKTETATRVRQRIELILDWAVAAKFRPPGENPARWIGNLKHLLPAPKTVRKKRNWPSLPFSQVPAFIEALRQQEGDAARALEFLILTASRTEPICAALLPEADYAAKAWTSPAEHMKGENPKDHCVPLCPRAVEILRELDKTRAAGETHIFSGGKLDKGMSNGAMLALLKRMDPDSTKWIDPKQGSRRIVPHGFRASFRTWASECTAYDHETKEMALAHTIEDKTEEAYRRGDLFDKRLPLMRDWGRYCEGGAPAKRKAAA